MNKIVALLITVFAICVSSAPGNTDISAHLPVRVRTQTALSPRIYLPLVTRPRLIRNAGFEEGQWQKAVYWIWPWHDAIFYEGYQEIRPPVGWTAWWVQGRFCEHNEEFMTGRPEFTLIFDWQDENRVAEGSQAAKAFTFWRCGLFGYYQRVALSSGNYRFGIRAHTWYTSCSADRYGSVPKDGNCNPLTNEHMYIWVGIDSISACASLSACLPDPQAGGHAQADAHADREEEILYKSPSIRWSAPAEQYGLYGSDYLWTPTVWVEETATFWIKTESWQPLKHNDLYVDAVVLEEE